MSDETTSTESGSPETQPSATVAGASGRFQIKSPNPNFSGSRNQLQFQDGVAYTDDPIAADLAGRAGCKVHDSKPPKPQEPFEKPEK